MTHSDAVWIYKGHATVNLQSTITMLLYHKLLLVLLLSGGHQMTGIEHGSKVPDGVMQYMVSVQNNKGHVCGGFLVSDDFVLTAAHCDQLTKVILGNHNLDVGNTTKIKKQIKHESFKEWMSGNDLMLLELEKKAENIRKATLPTVNMKVKAHDLCQVAGWGRTSEHSGPVVNLMAANVSIIDITNCKKNCSILPDNVTCAKGCTNIKFYQDDFGGPLVCNNTTVGLLSFNKFEQQIFPNVFVDISKYLLWINEKIAS
uniref:trypsin n=1 Tax=Periophthalmus magnuspinnatus TaxID=409849 RepID=A0A3B4AMP3_9GOBI